METIPFFVKKARAVLCIGRLETEILALADASNSRCTNQMQNQMEGLRCISGTIILSNPTRSGTGRKPASAIPAIPRPRSSRTTTSSRTRVAKTISSSDSCSGVLAGATYDPPGGTMPPSNKARLQIRRRACKKQNHAYAGAPCFPLVAGSAEAASVGWASCPSPTASGSAPRYLSRYS